MVCTIRIERLDDRRYRATCTLLPEFEVLAAIEEVARQGMQEAIERWLTEGWRPDGPVSLV